VYPKNILIVYEQAGAPQSYVRGKLLEELFKKNGINIKSVFLHAAGNTNVGIYSRVKRRFSNKFHKEIILINEHRIALLSKKYDIVLFIKVPSLRLVKLIKEYSSAKLIYDLADFVDTKSYQSPSKAEIESILKIVDVVTYDCNSAKDCALKFNKNIHSWPTCSQVEHFDKVRQDKYRNGGSINIGWIGSPSTSFNLFKIWEPLERIFSKYDNIRLTLLGADKKLIPMFENVSYSLYPGYYSPEKMIEEGLKMDIGIFPQFSNELAKTHGYLKALVYMGAGAALVCSPVGDINELIIDGENGFLAKDEYEWHDKLERLIIDEDLRKRISANGLKTAREDKFSIKHSYEELMKAFLK
jgi:glycosyltransferase involved in cell wall biosynthesis